MDRARLVRKIKELIIRELDLRGKTPDDIDEDQQLFGGGLSLDSLDALQLAMAIEEQYGVNIPEGEAAREIFASVAAIVDHIQSSQSEQ